MPVSFSHTVYNCDLITAPLHDDLFNVEWFVNDDYSLHLQKKPGRRIGLSNLTITTFIYQGNPMKQYLISFLALSPLTTLAIPAHADDDGSIKSRIEAVETQASANSAAIAGNTGAIGANARAIAINATAIAEISKEPSYDYRDYSTATNISSKVLAISGGGMAATDCLTETRTTTRVNVNSIETSTLDRVRTTSTGLNCGFQRFTFEARADGRYMTVNDLRTADGAASRIHRAIDDGMLMRTTNMQVGKSFGNASATTITRSTGVTQASVVQNVTFQGIESVTVPYNGGTTFNECMKVHIDRSSQDGLGGDGFKQVSWYCKDVGLVKRIDSRSNVWQLTDIVFTP